MSALANREVAALALAMSEAGWQVADDNATDGYVTLDYAVYSATESFHVRVRLRAHPGACNLRDSRESRQHTYASVGALRAALNRRGLLTRQTSDNEA